MELVYLGFTNTSKEHYKMGLENGQSYEIIGVFNVGFVENLE